MLARYIKTLIFFGLLLISCKSEAATTWYACTSGGNWSANVWTSVSADQGTCVSALGTPVAGDTAILNSSSGNITITSSAAAASLTMTGYTGTLAVGAQTLTMNGGTVTLATGNTITASSGGMTITGTETLTSGGQTWPGTLTLNVAGTVTLSNSGATWTNTGLVTFSAATLLSKNITGDTLTANGGLTVNAQTGAGTATIILGGGTWSGNNVLENSLTFAGNVTVSGSVIYGAAANPTMTYSSGTITTTGSTVTFHNATLNTNGITWNNITIAGSSFTITLTSNLSVGGTLSEINLGSITFSGAYNITTATLTISSISVATTISLVAGQTINVTTALNLIGNPTYALAFKSATPSSNTYINYTGSVANDNVYDTAFTDVVSSGQSIYNYNGTTLRTSNILNTTATNFVSFGTVSSTGGISIN